MVKYMKLSLVGFFCVAASVFAWPNTPPQETPAEKVFKNIKALKGFPAGQMTPLMEAFNKALGVDCDYCHVPGALEKADKPAHQKSIRDIQMTREIMTRYKTNLDCMSCHRGQKIPPASLLALGVAGVPPGGTVAKTEPAKTEPAKTEPAKSEPAKTEPAKSEPAASEAEPPGDDVVLRASFGRVPFPHARHMSAVSDCATCHHTGENNKCSVCHQKTPSAVTKIRAQDAAHSRTSQRACAGCHITQKVGPTTCATCHKR